MNEIINTVLPLMTVLVQKPGLNTSADQISEAAADLTALMADASNKVLKMLGQDDPKYLAAVNRILALLVAKTWQVAEIDSGSSEKIAQIFIAVIDNIEIDIDQVFDTDNENMTIGIDTVGWVAKCLPPIIELREIDPEKSSKGKLLLGQKSYEQNIAFIQKKITKTTEQLAKRMMVKDPDAERNLGQAVSDLFAVILQTQFEMLSAKIKGTITTEAQKKFLKEKSMYPEGILIEKGLEHLDSILKCCFPGEEG